MTSGNPWDIHYYTRKGPHTADSFSSLLHKICNRHNLVSIVTWLWAAWSMVHIQAGPTGFFLFSKMSWPASRLTQPRIKWVSAVGGGLVGAKSGYEAVNSLPPSTDIKTRVKLCAHSPLYEFMFSPGTIVRSPLWDTMLKQWLIVGKNRPRFWSCYIPITKANKMRCLPPLFR